MWRPAQPSRYRPCQCLPLKLCLLGAYCASLAQPYPLPTTMLGGGQTSRVPTSLPPCTLGSTLHGPEQPSKLLAYLLPPLKSPLPSLHSQCSPPPSAGGLSGGVTEDQLRALFAPYGDIVYVKIPPGKGCGFVQYVQRSAAEQAMQVMQVGRQFLHLHFRRALFPDAGRLQRSLAASKGLLCKWGVQYSMCGWIQCKSNAVGQALHSDDPLATEGDRNGFLLPAGVSVACGSCMAARADAVHSGDAGGQGPGAGFWVGPQGCQVRGHPWLRGWGWQCGRYCRAMAASDALPVAL